MILLERFSYLRIAVLALGLSVSPAWASGDIGDDTPHWTLRQSPDNQYSNLPFLNPSNDSRVNLLLLLLDEGHAKFRPSSDEQAAAIWSSAEPIPFSTFTTLLDTQPVAGQPDTGLSQGEGSRCVSNEAGAVDFHAALAEVKDLPASELAALSAARKALSPTCNEASNTAPAPLDAVQSAIGRQFAAYLTGASAFYDGRFAVAEQQFTSASDSDQPWLKQAAVYMLGRVSLNQAQVNAFDKDDGLLKRDKVDAATLATAAARLQTYLQMYPDGKYAASARGLMRRVTWLGGEFQKLSEEFAFQLDHASSPAAIALTAEVDLKLMSAIDPATTKDVRLLAMWDLVQIRQAIPAADNKFRFELAALEAQKPSFAGHEDLFTYLLAAHAVYVDNQPAKALALLPAAAPVQPMSFLAFSRQVLRGLALEATRDAKGAGKHWEGLLAQAQPILQRPAVELALAMNYERAGAVATMFAPTSPIRDAALREVLLVNSADAGVLRQTASAGGTPKERAIALSTLLRKDLILKRYRAFGEDLTLLPKDAVEADKKDDGTPDLTVFNWPGAKEDYECPALADTARTLARKPNQLASLICLAEFFRLNEELGDFATVPADELGGAPSPFPARSFSRQEVYQKVIADRKASPADRSYALYRAIHCYASTGNNHCGGTAVPLKERAKWFRILKTDYPKSPWAETPYYW